MSDAASTGPATARADRFPPLSDPLVSVVVCTHTLDRCEHVVAAVESVLGGSYDRREVIAVSDGNERVADRLRDELGDREDVRVVYNQADGGLSASRNVGVDRADGDVVAFLDDDAVAGDDWLAELVRAYTDEGALAAGGRMTGRWLAGRPAFLPAEFDWLVGVTHRGFAGRADPADPSAAGEVRNTFGSNLSFRTDVFGALGGFSTEIGMADDQIQAEEPELCARLAREFGAGVYYVPEATVAHKVFEYRTDPVWLARRAFWQGYSKRALETMAPEATGEEDEFLRLLVGRFLPDRAVGLVRSPSVERAGQLLALVVLTGLTGVGYLYGAVERG